MSQDLEDLLRIIVFRSELSSELNAASRESRSYLRSFLKDFLSLDDLDELLEAHLPGHGQRAKGILDTHLGTLLQN